jgi:hypothetical protein
LEIGPKRLELLHNLIPSASVIGLLINPTNPRLAEQNIKSLQSAGRTFGLEMHVLQASRQTATLEPAKFVAICASLIPKDVSLTLSARLPGDLNPDDWQIALALFGAIKDALPNANQRPPGEVMQYVLDAIRTHDAKLIEPESE